MCLHTLPGRWRVAIRRLDNIDYQRYNRTLPGFFHLGAQPRFMMNLHLASLTVPIGTFAAGVESSKRLYNRPLQLLYGTPGTAVFAKLLSP